MGAFFMFRAFDRPFFRSKGCHLLYAALQQESVTGLAAPLYRSLLGPDCQALPNDGMPAG